MFVFFFISDAMIKQFYYMVRKKAKKRGWGLVGGEWWGRRFFLFTIHYPPYPFLQGTEVGLGRGKKN
jgi:hypothetical protein